ncbi:DUF4296 domain-containing protein [Flavobacterium capsici]|uniref:DUF4296 domain-containing protein n=1 Tax=Flavobacterium capsici TaxID=3075618 RepID=A0AA96J6A6_9FLAO|nr:MULTISPECIES: DUF4296 domain-containing protein [unclassified Flavobacterium]WNM19891.1 DUF4296 domain-containing protein [Flavobacterium sp. PMR2A8]WNM21280.1 DUF4296 domain-containing protein [Flavobacterium sp. PMTSA4]
MKKVLLFCIIVLAFGCQKTAVEKPSDLIEKDKMVDILYDISLLEAVKTQNIGGGITSEQINKFIYKKYKIDSLQFLNSNKYYASDVAEYKKMYQKVKDRLDEENKNLEGKLKKEDNLTSPNDNKNNDTPAVY